MHSYVLVGKFYAFLDAVACKKKATIIFFLSVHMQVSDRLLTGRIFVKFFVSADFRSRPTFLYCLTP
jgi:hypothetical protein